MKRLFKLFVMGCISVSLLSGPVCVWAMEAEEEALELLAEEKVEESVVEEPVEEETVVESDTESLVQDDEELLGAGTYNPSAAVAYAHANAKGSGFCDAFVRECLRAGGMNFSAVGSGPLKNEIINSGMFVRYPLAKSDVRIRSDGSNSGKIAVGDVIVYECIYGYDPHIVLVSKIENGIVYACGHNGSWYDEEYLAGYSDENGHSCKSGQLSIAVLHYTGKAFTGYFDGAIAYPGLIAVHGWAFDNSYPTDSCRIDIYIGNDANPARCITNKVKRDDVKSAYPQTTNMMGFYDVFQTAKWGVGEKEVKMYAVNVSKNRYELISTKKVTFQANVAPKVTDVKVSNVTSTGYTVTCKVSDSLPEDLQSIQFRTTVNGKTSAYANGNYDGTTASFNVYIKDFSNQKGTYQTEVCATDKSGASTTVKASAVTIDDPLSVKSQSLLLGGTIGLNFDLYIPQSLRSDTGAYVMINGNKTLISSATKTGDNYRFTYKVNAKQMNDDCTLTVYNKSGSKVNIGNTTAVNGSYVYSVGKYLDDVIAKSSDVNMVNLAKSMKNYGYAAQKYLGYNTAKAGTLPQYQKIDFASYKPVVTGNLPAGLEYKGSSLMLNDNTSIRHYYVVKSGHSISEYSFKTSGTAVKPISAGGNVYYVAVTGIGANKLSNSYTVTINDSYSLGYGPMSYAYKAVQKNSGDALATLMYSMEDYNKKAKTYFGN